MDFIKDLNNKQYEAASTSSRVVRIIAGAGSGKTRVLTYRIAFLLNERYVNPWSILAITFTNKVAKEMKERVEKLVPSCSKSLSIRTFHSFAAYFLRQEIPSIGFPSTFSILDEEDQTKLIKDIAQSLGYRRGDEIVKKSLNYIAACKLKGLYPQDVVIKHEEFDGHKTCLQIFELYEDEKNRMFALDFDDLLLKANFILENFPNVRFKWQERIDHILVDEFQDTNDIEFKLIKLLLKDTTELYVVGDPDQTIYTWRGANQRIIIDLNKLFSDIETIPLEQNYRSTQVILDSANKLIANNKLRLPKNLFTETRGGEAVVIKPTYSSKEEAGYVVSQIRMLRDRYGYSLRDIAILYRSNYVSVDFETALTQAGIQYQVYGGMKFFQRKEIKDVVAYFNLIVNPYNDVAFERIINAPKRGIGDVSLNTIKEEALKKNLSFYETIKQADETSTISKKNLFVLKSMIQRIELAKSDIDKKEEVFSKILEDLIRDLGYYDYIIQEEEGEDRLDNVKELFQDLRSYLHNDPEASFESYLQNISLMSAQDDVIEGDFVSLMTAHTAKGLEYPVIFIVRFNQTVFPNARALNEGGFEALEEERRLAYVAITRAKERLYITCSGGYSYVSGGDLTPSQFISESGNTIKTSSGAFNPYAKPTMYGKPRQYSDIYSSNKPAPKATEIITNKPMDNGITDWKVGDVLLHKTLGKGIVIALEGDGILTVEFENCGQKSIMGNHPYVSKGE